MIDLHHILIFLAGMLVGELGMLWVLALCRAAKDN